MKIADKTKEEMLKELNRLKDQMVSMNKVREKYEQTLETLRKKEEKYEFIVNAHNEYLSLINREYKYEAVNDAYCMGVKKNREDIIGKTVDLIWGRQIFENNIKPHLDNCFNGEIVKFETHFKVGDNKELYYSVNYYPYKNNEGEVIHAVAVTRDITDKKIAELELIESEKRLRELNKRKDEYLDIINTDLIRAENYILSLLPPPMNNDLIKTNWVIKPCSRLGGDAFGYQWLDDNNFAFYILDVSGHGVGAALHSISALTMLRFRTLLHTDFYQPDRVLCSLNRTFNMERHNDLYFTMWYCVFNLQTRTLSYAGAGHPPLILIDRNNRASLVESKNFVIGYSPDLTYKSGKINLEIGSRVYMYSDGAYEVRKPDGKMMTIEELSDYLQQSGTNDGSELTKFYNYLVKLTGDKLEDDFLMLRVNIN
jgi:PAS domain S-box-containing protein